MGPLAYVSGVEASVSLRSELRGRLWFNHFGQQSLFDVGHAPILGALDEEQTCRPIFNRQL
jgi:hypothetical protein